MRFVSVARTLTALAGASTAWAVLVVATGGIRTTIAGHVISSRNPVRPAVAALILVAIAWLLNPAEVEARASRLMVLTDRQLSRWVVPIAAVSLLLFAVTFNVRMAGAADAFGYVSQALLWLRGEPTIDQPFAASVPWPNADWTLSPLGYRPADGHRLVPTYAPGLPLLMAVASLASLCGPYYIAPVAGAALVLLTAALGRRMFELDAAGAAAVMVAASPVVVWWSLAPMSDVPVAAFWLAALLAADSPRCWRAALAGVLAGVAIAIRPNLVPLAIFPMLLTMVQGGSRLDRVARGGALCAGVAPFVTLVGLVNHYLYGSALTSGYGTVGSIYSGSYLTSNLLRYPVWWWHAHGVIGCLCVLALFRPRPPMTRKRVIVVTAFAAAVFWAYAFYLPFDDWAYLRFLTPALPVVMLLSTDAIVWLASRKGAVIRSSALAACTALAVVQGIHRARSDGFHRFADADQTFVDAAAYIGANTPQASVVYSMLHSGSIRYYAGRQTLRFDILDPAWLDQSVDALERRGYKAYALLETDEESAFRTRFAGQRSVTALDEGLLAVRSSPGRELKLFELGATARRLPHGPIEMPRTSRFDCLGPSRRFGRETTTSLAAGDSVLLSSSPARGR